MPSDGQCLISQRWGQWERPLPRKNHQADGCNHNFIRGIFLVANRYFFLLFSNRSLFRSSAQTFRCKRAHATLYVAQRENMCILPFVFPSTFDEVTRLVRSMRSESARGFWCRWSACTRLASRLCALVIRQVTTNISHSPNATWIFQMESRDSKRCGILSSLK